MPPRDKGNVTQEEIQELRDRFLQELDETTAEEYHLDDVQRVKENDWFLTRYILHHHNKIDNALKMLIESLRWRKEYEINTLTRANLPAEYFNNRGAFHYNEDKNDIPIVVIRVKTHIKDEKMLKLQKQYTTYWVEKVIRDNNWGAATILFDCTDSGLSNVDMEMTRFIVNLFKKYYPWGLGHILVCNLPWILSAVWRIVKTWIPEQYSGKVNFVDQVTLRDFVDEDHIPSCLGGKCLKLYEPKEGAEDASEDEGVASEIM